MTEQTPESTPEESALAKFKEEMQSEFQQMKTSLESQIEDLKKTNESLIAENKELNRALVRSATEPIPEQTPRLTPEEQYEKERREFLKNVFEKSRGLTHVNKH